MSLARMDQNGCQLVFQEPAASNSTNSRDILIRPGTPGNKGFYIFTFFVKTSDSSRFKIILKHLFHSQNLALKSCASSHFGNIQFHDHGCKARINALEPEVESCNHKIWFSQFFTALALEKKFFFLQNICQTISIYVILSNEVY